MELNQQISDFKKIVDQVNGGRFDIVDKPVLNDTHRQIKVQQALSRYKVQLDSQKTEYENKLRWHREEIGRMKHTVEKTEIQLEQKQKCLDQLMNRLERQQDSQASAVKKQYHEQTESAKQLSMSLRVTEAQLDRKRRTLHKLASIVKKRRRAVKDWSARKLASNRKQELHLKRKADLLRLEKQKNQTEIQQQIANIEQQRLALLAQSKGLQEKRHELDEQQKSIESQGKSLNQKLESIQQQSTDLELPHPEQLRIKELRDRQRVECLENRSVEIERETKIEIDAADPERGLDPCSSKKQEVVAVHQPSDEMQLILMSKIRRRRFEKTKLFRCYSWFLDHINRAKNGNPEMWQ